MCLCSICHATLEWVGQCWQVCIKPVSWVPISVSKMDGDGQMDPRYIPLLVEPLITGKADYTKGNCFRSALTLAQMPLVRRLGNAVLSLLTKFASGYWNIFDPTNGYIAIRREVFEMLPPKMIHPRYFFESSLLIALGILGAVVLDIPMQARVTVQKSPCCASAK